MPKLPSPSSNLVPAADPAPHQRIKDLAKLPRGKAWASRLCAFEEVIRAQRKAHKSYREIAAWLDTQGLHVSPFKRAWLREGAGTAQTPALRLARTDRCALPPGELHFQTQAAQTRLIPSPPHDRESHENESTRQ